MRIRQLLASAGLTGFYFDDQRAIKRGARMDGFAYRGKPVTEGFTSVRQAGESVSIMLVLDDGQVAYGDCAAVQYSGAGGRDPLFLARDFIPVVHEAVAPVLVGAEARSFRELAQQVDAIRFGGRRLHTAVRYGATQAVLDAVARSRGLTMAEVVAEEFGCVLEDKPVPIFAQTGDDRYINADKCIIKRVDVLPHGLVNNVPLKLGRRGELLREYVVWLRNRARKLGGRDYRPVLHVDVYGTIGIAFRNNMRKIADYLCELGELARPLRLRIEGPVDVENKPGQIEALQKLRRMVRESGGRVEIVADEWCNTLEDIKEFADAGAGDMIQIKTPDLGGIHNSAEAVLYCKSRGIGAYVGGTCNETDRSAQVCVHVALATRADQMLAKPGMGVDEGLATVYNEMQRTLELIRWRRRQAARADAGPTGDGG